MKFKNYMEVETTEKWLLSVFSYQTYLLVHKINVSGRRFFYAPKTYILLRVNKIVNE